KRCGKDCISGRERGYPSRRLSNSWGAYLRAIAQAAIRSGERCPAATRSGVGPASGQYSLGGASTPKFGVPGVGGTSAHAPTRRSCDRDRAAVASRGALDRGRGEAIDELVFLVGDEFVEDQVL